MRKHIILLSLALCLAIGLQAQGNIPVIYLTTPDSTAITSREEWKKHVDMRIVLPDHSIAYHSTDIQVKGRGHSTFTKPKKPYALKLGHPAPLLGMKTGKRWVLLANFMDHSLLRNSLALAIARQTSLDWTPDCRLVDVVLNGTPQGCYLLCEAIRVDPDRVDIDPEEGFLIEMDSYPDDHARITTRHRHLPVNITHPKDPSPQQVADIAACLDRVEDALYGEGNDMATTCRDLIDMDSFADWWIVHELTQNAEPNGPRSCYMHQPSKHAGLKAGPVWDFDLAFITVGLDQGGDLRPARLNRTDVTLLDGDCLYNRQALWYDRLLKHPAFVHHVRQRWKVLEPKFRALTADLDRWQTLIRPSALADEQLWQGKDPARFDPSNSWEEAVSNLRKTYTYRLDRLTALLAEL